MKTRLFYLLLCLTCAQLLSAQFTFDGKRPFYDKDQHLFILTVPEEYFGQSHTFEFVPDDTIKKVVKDGIFVTTHMPFKIIKGDTTYSFNYSSVNSGGYARVRFTHLPVVKLVGTIADEYVVGEFLMQVPDDTVTRRMSAKIKWAGSSTNRPWYKKHNYHIKFLDDNGDKMDVSFYGLRNDNHWRMDGGVIDLGRIRNKVSHELWADMAARPYYADVQPKAKTHVNGFFVEFFDNDRYKGFSNMSEYLDRKQMKLKKYDDANGEFHGMLWKAKEDTWQTLMAVDSIYDNTQDNWGGFDLEYPQLEDVSPTDYHILSDAINFVQNSSNAEFHEHVSEYFDIPVLVDYYLFVNVLLASDNLCKNIIWGCYDGAVDKKLTLAVWDLDAVMGQNWTNADGYYRSPDVAPENDLTQMSLLASNLLFTRLMKWPTFHRKAISRYWQLRNNVLTADSIINRFASHYDVLRHSGAIYREEAMYNMGSDLFRHELNFQAELEYLSDWLYRRFDYLDNNSVFTMIPGDVDVDGEVGISDVNTIIDILLNTMEDVSILEFADIDGDGEISIADLNAEIDMILLM